MYKLKEYRLNMHKNIFVRCLTNHSMRIRCSYMTLLLSITHCSTFYVFVIELQSACTILEKKKRHFNTFSSCDIKIYRKKRLMNVELLGRLLRSVHLNRNDFISCKFSFFLFKAAQKCCMLIYLYSFAIFHIARPAMWRLCMPMLPYIDAESIYCAALNCLWNSLAKFENCQKIH